MLKKFNLSAITGTIKTITQIGLVVMCFVKAFEVLSEELEKVGESKTTNEKAESNE